MVFKTLLLGGLHTGKTTLLTSMFEECINGPLADLFAISDYTRYDNRYNRPTLSTKKLEILDVLSSVNGSCNFLLDSGPSFAVWDYQFKFFLPGHPPRQNVEIHFTDVPGSYLVNGFDLHVNQLRDVVGNSDAVVVTIDTPYLMEASDTIEEVVNVTNEIHHLLTYIDDNGGRKPKMIVFSPLKCEKWMKEGRIGEVVERVKRKFATSINMLKCMKTNICIMPMETIGSIVFSELKDVYELRSGNNFHYRCAKLTDSIVRLTDGTLRKLMEGEMLNTSQDSFRGNFPIPAAWYHLDTDSKTLLYKPRHCDQLPLHLLRFFLRSIIHQYRDRHFILPPYPSYYHHFLTLIEQSNLILDQKDGIEYIQKVV